MPEKIRVLHGDCRNEVRNLADSCIDACVTDGPYALVSITKRFGGEGAAPATAKEGGSGVYVRASAGFMGQKWDTGETYFDPDFWREMFRVLKPGAHVLAFAGTRTYHRLACAIEDAGFEIRDQIGWAYGSGFPKSHDLAKQLDKRGGVWRGRSTRALPNQSVAKGVEYERVPKGAAISEEARQWEGWGTALKPAWEPICVARKPLIGTVADNVLAHGVGALNIDGCRIHADDALGDEYALKRLKPGADLKATGGNWRPEDGDDFHGFQKPGRWPANIVHDGSADVVEAFPDSVTSRCEKPSACSTEGVTDFDAMRGDRPARGYDGDGSAARFFYTAKADEDDRLGSRHPTVKPIDLMRWLVRLVVPRGATVIDPFAGSGTTGIAAMVEGCEAILIEREESYVADINARIAYATGEGRHSGALKARRRQQEQAGGPLFTAAQ